MSLAWYQDPDERADAIYDPTLTARSTTPRADFPPDLLRASELAEEARREQGARR